MLWTTYNLNLKSLLIFGKHTRNCRHKSWSFHLSNSILKMSAIRAKWLWLKMTFLSSPAYQFSAWYQESASRFLEVLRREKVSSSSDGVRTTSEFTCVSCFDLRFVWAFTGTILSLQNNSAFSAGDDKKKNLLVLIFFLNQLFVPMLILARRDYKDFLE